MNSITGPQAFFQIVPAFDRLLRRGLWAVALAFLSVGGWLSYDEAAPVDRPQLASAVASVRAVNETPGSSREAAPVESLSKPISQLRTMHDRVRAHNPLPGETESPLTDINPEQWRVVTLQHVQPDGSRAIVERGVPLDEINAEGLSVGRRLHMTLPEFNLSGDFTVTGIDACPTPASGDGHLVTSRFIHENTEVWDLSFERGSAPLGTTASHPFWSEDRQDFVAARDLYLGERLLLADSTTRRLESLTKRPERTTVYNIEVNAQHTYYVGRDGVLVHNTCEATVYIHRDHVKVGISNASGETITHMIVPSHQGRIRNPKILNGKGTLIEKGKGHTVRMTKSISENAANKAKKVQEGLVGKTGTYKFTKRSCATHVSDILKAAGINNSIVSRENIEKILTKRPTKN